MRFRFYPTLGAWVDKITGRIVLATPGSVFETQGINPTALHMKVFTLGRSNAA